MKEQTVAFKLKLPETMSKLHPWFHVSLLRPYSDGGRVDFVPPPAVIVDDEIEYFVEKIISQKTWLITRLSILSNGHYMVGKICC